MFSAAEQQAKTAADDFRRVHGLGVQPLGDLAALIEQTTGYDVAVLEADSDEHGLTMRDPSRRRAFIGIASTRNPMRQRSTLAHELAHLVFDDEAEDLGLRSPEEIRADAFARHFLIPVEGVCDFLDDRTWEGETMLTLSEVVQRFLVSPAIAAIAMRDAKVITAEVAAIWMRIGTPELATRFGWSDFYSALQDDSSRLRAPQGLVSRAIVGYEAGVVSAQTIATLRGVSAETVQTELSAIGIIPRKLNTSEFEVDELPDVEIDLSGLEDEDLSL